MIRVKAAVLATAAVMSSMAALAGGATSASASPTSTTGTCGDVFDVFISGAEAHWTVTCSGSQVIMDGRVDDTRADGRCAEVKGVFSDHTDIARNCPATSPPTRFRFSGPGNTVNGFLYLN